MEKRALEEFDFRIISNSNLSIKSSLRTASLREHEWYMGEKEKNAIETDKALVNWEVKGYDAWFRSATSQEKMPNIRERVLDKVRREELKLDKYGLPIITEKIMHELIGYAQAKPF